MDLLSMGIDPKKATIFVQSRIPEIAELTVFYSNLVTVSRLFRNPTVKTEVAQKRHFLGKVVSLLLMAFWDTQLVKQQILRHSWENSFLVGEDQLPLLEQCREIVRKFNSIYGDTLKEPEAYLSENKRIKGLDGNEKMGKSLGNAIYFADTPEEVNRKVMGAITHPNKIRKDDPANPDVCMVYYYHKLFNEEHLSTVCKECKQGKRGCVACKRELAAAINQYLQPFREKRSYYESHPEEVDKILEEGTKRAREKAKQTMKQVKKAMQIDYGDE